MAKYRQVMNRYTPDMGFNLDGFHIILVPIQLFLLVMADLRGFASRLIVYPEKRALPVRQMGWKVECEGITIRRTLLIERLILRDALISNHGTVGGIERDG